MDLDIELTHSLNELFTAENNIFLVESSNVQNYYTNSMMASVPGCSLWYEAIEEMKKPLHWWAIGKHLKVMNSTGPLMISRVARSGCSVYAVLPSKRVNPCSKCEIVCNKPDAYVKPLPGMSWVEVDTKIYTFFWCNWKNISLTIALLLLILVIYLVYRRLHR